MESYLFQDVCAHLLGSEWHRPIARELGAYHPDGPRDQIDDRLVRRWAAGARPIPEWVTGALVAIADKKMAEHQKAIARLSTMTRMLRETQQGALALVERVPQVME